MFVFSELGPSSDLFIVHQRSSFSFLPLNQLPITTPQRLVVCFWGFLNIFMWGAGIACGGGVDGWSTSSDGDSSEISERLEVKVKRSKKNPSELCRSPSLYDDLRASRFRPGLLKYCVCHAMINCLLTVDTQFQTYTHLTRTFTLQQIHVLTPTDGLQLCICMCFKALWLWFRLKTAGLRRTTQLCI